MKTQTPFPPQPWFELGAIYLSCAITEHILDDFLPIREHLDNHRFSTGCFGNEEAVTKIQEALALNKPIMSSQRFPIIEGLEEIEFVIVTSGYRKYTLVMTAEEYRDESIYRINAEEILRLLSETKCQT